MTGLFISMTEYPGSRILINCQSTRRYLLVTLSYPPDGDVDVRHVEECLYDPLGVSTIIY